MTKRLMSLIPLELRQRFGVSSSDLRRLIFHISQAEPAVERSSFASLRQDRQWLEELRSHLKSGGGYLYYSPGEFAELTRHLGIKSEVCDRNYQTERGVFQVHQVYNGDLFPYKAYVCVSTLVVQG